MNCTRRVPSYVHVSFVTIVLERVGEVFTHFEMIRDRRETVQEVVGKWSCPGEQTVLSNVKFK